MAIKSFRKTLFSNNCHKKFPKSSFLNNCRKKVPEKVINENINFISKKFPKNWNKKVSRAFTKGTKKVPKNLNKTKNRNTLKIQ